MTSGEENPDASDGHMDENDITQKTEKENIHMASPTAPQADTPLAAGKVTYETTDNYTHNIYANGQPLIMESSVTVKNGKTVIPAHEYMVSYQDNLNAGSASVIITDNPGGNFIINGRTEFEIINEYCPENGVDYITTPLKDGWTNSDFVIRAMDHRLLSSGNTLNDQWVTEIARSGETEGAPVSFYVKNTETGAISLMTTEQYRLDRTKPEDFDIRFNRNSVKKLIHEVTFGLLFRETVDVTITAKDSLSGIGGISYFLSDSVLSEEQVGRITDWTDGSAFSLTPEDAKQFIVYAKAADRAGNLVCFASDGAEFDLTPPAITGVTEDKVYYTTQTVSVTDRHPGTVTLDGQNVSGDLILPGNIEKTYVIKTADQAGNESSASITMKPIQDIAEPIQGLTAATVTSDNQPDIRAVITELDLLLESEPATEQEKSLIKELKSDAEVLDTQITSAGKAADTAEIQAVEGISDETVSLEDKEHLVQAREALEKALNEYGGNYTEQEKQAIIASGRMTGTRTLFLKQTDLSGSLRGFWLTVSRLIPEITPQNPEVRLLR